MPQKIDRATAVKHLKKQWAVMDANGRLLERVGELPPAVEGEPEPELFATRHESGHLTYEAIQAILRNGGSYMHNGVIIDKLDDLPDAAEMAQGDANRLAAVKAGLDEQLAKLQAQRASVTEAEEKAKAEAAKQPPPEAPKQPGRQPHPAAAGASGAHPPAHPPGRNK